MKRSFITQGLGLLSSLFMQKKKKNSQFAFSPKMQLFSDFKAVS